METNLVQPSRLALQLGSRNLGQAATAIEKTLPKPSTRPAPMTDAARKKRLSELTCQLGSVAAAKSALGMEIAMRN